MWGNSNNSFDTGDLIEKKQKKVLGHLSVKDISVFYMHSASQHYITYLSKVFVVTVVIHLLYTFARSARCISWNNVAAVDSKDKESWSLPVHNIMCQLWIHGR